MPIKPVEKQWFVEHGLWVQAHRRREELKAGGMVPKLACRQVVAELYRPDGPAAVSAASEGPTVPLETNTALATASKVVFGGANESLLKGKVAEDPSSGNLEAIQGVAPERSQASAESTTNQVKPALESPPAAAGDLMSKEQALATRDTSMLKAVKWVASVLGVRGLVPEDSPSPQAWSMYLTYRAQAMWPVFWKEFGKAMLPSKADIESKDRMTDDGREQLELLDRLERERDAASATANAPAVANAGGA